MKEISEELRSAILDKSSSTMRVRATIDPSRTFFEEPDSTNAYDTEDYSIPTDDPVGQCIVHLNDDRIITFIVDKATETIYGMEDGDGTPHSLGITANVNTKPGAIESSWDKGKIELYWWNNGLWKGTVDPSTWDSVLAQEVSVDPYSQWGIEEGSPTILSYDQILLCYKTTKGGIGVAIKDGPTWYHWGQRFISPNALSETAWTIYTTGIAFKGKIYVYSTDISEGTVRAIEYNPYKHSWSDIFIALPADFSRFDVSNAIVSNDYVHLAGQFHRTGEHIEARSYALILRSADGKAFSWDKFTLLSNIGYRFHIAANNTTKKIYASDRNSIGIADMSYYFHSIPNNRVVLCPNDMAQNDPNVSFYSGIISFSSNGDQATLQVASANEQAIMNKTIHKDNRVKIELGYRIDNVEDKDKYVNYGTYIIDKVNTSYKDGSRKLVLSLVNEGVWKTNKIAFPFYAEILSKTSMFDNCDSQDQMYAQSCVSAENLEYLSIDFWHSEEWETSEVPGTPFSWYKYWNSVTQRILSFTGTVKGKTVDFTAHPQMNSFPTVTGEMTVKLYGWEDGINRGQSTFNVYAVTAPEDGINDETITQGAPTTAQTFPKRGSGGAYPMEFTFSGIEEGHKLKYFGITATNGSSGRCYIYLERLEVWTGIQFAYSALTSSTPWSLEFPPDGDRKYLLSPDTGLQNLMFTTKPYSAFNYNISAEFGYSAGDYPLSPGTTAWGVVGLAKDGYDYILARYRKQSSSLQLVLMRNGKTTILQEIPMDPVYGIMMDHRNGRIRVYILDSNVWVGPAIDYSYDEITHGVISTSETGIMHTGIYAAVYPPSFMAAALAEPYSKGICMTKDQTVNVLQGFPPSGFVTIDGQKYKYTGKAINASLPHNKTYGPYQLRQVSNVNGMGLECALFKPENPAGLLAGLLIGQSNHHTWRITSTDWTVVHSTGGVAQPLNNRSHHYSPDAIPDQNYAASTDDRVYLNHGLKGITLEDDTAYYHSDGALCSLWSTDKIWVKKVVATQIDHDATVKDMLAYLCRTASIEAEFPGDWTSDSVEISSTPVTLAEDKDIFPGGCDLHFAIPLLADNDYVALKATNLKLSETEETIELGIERINGSLYVYIDPDGDTPKQSIRTPLYANYDPGDGKAHDIRILIHDDFLSFYGDDISLATFALGEEDLEWPTEPVIIQAYSNTNLTIRDVTISELFDWREAIYIESELSVSSAIGSVIQERPIDIYTTEEGNLSFSYYFERDEIVYTAAHAHRILESHEKIHQNSDNAGSDALVYYADITFAEHDNYAITDGFSTRVFRLSNLETGAELAAKILLEKAYEKQNMHRFVLRPDLRLEIGDIVDWTYNVSGTGTQITARGIIEDINVNIEEGKHTMALTARDRE